MPVVLDVEGGGCHRGGRQLFANLCFRLSGGDALAVRGANGVGKTSLLRQLAGFLPAEGNIRLTVDTGSVVDSELRGKYIAWLGTQEAIKPVETVAEHLAFFARLCRAADTVVSVNDVLLQRFGLKGEWPCGKLSAGQRRRLGLARLTLLGRPIWLLDEPMALLDVQGQALANQIMAEHLSRGGIVIAAGHEPLQFTCQTLNLGRGG